MAKKTAALLPTTAELLHRFGDRLRLARLRRRLPAKLVAERAGMAPMTLRSLERGGAGVTMGAYLAVMQVLGIESDLDLLGKADPVGRDLQDARLPAQTRPARPVVSSPAGRSAMDMGSRPDARQHTVPAVMPPPERETGSRPGRKAHKPAADEHDWIRKGGFVTADELARLIEIPAPPKKKRR